MKHGFPLSDDIDKWFVLCILYKPYLISKRILTGPPQGDRLNL